MLSTLDFSPRPAMRETNVPIEYYFYIMSADLRLEKLRKFKSSVCVEIISLQKIPVSESLAVEEELQSDQCFF